MGRSAVLSGRIDARDRAKLRGRKDRRHPPASDPLDGLYAWLKKSAYADMDSERVPALCTTDFLRETGCFAVEPAERLRHLAIFLETAVNPDDLRHLDRLYEAAMRVADADGVPVIWHSRGITAKFAAESASEGDAKAQAHALQCFHRAHALDPSDPAITYSIGKWHYVFEGVDEAASWFEQTLALAPTREWALLYRAHCLHDRKRWSEAVIAYEAVPLARFQGGHGYVHDVVLEALAYCRFQCGGSADALSDFHRLLDRFEREPRRAHYLSLVFLREVAEGPLREALNGRWERLQSDIHGVVI